MANLVEKSKDLAECISIFKEPNAPLEKLFEAGKKCIGGLYGTKITPAPVALDPLRFLAFKESVVKTGQKTQVFLSSLPPTDDAAEFHIKRVYLQIQTWLGFEVNPEEWGWKLNGENNGYVPIFMSKNPLPDDLQKIMFCSCTTGCGGSCGCRKAGLHCTMACKNCCGNDCENCNPAGAISVENDEEEAGANTLDFVSDEEVTYQDELNLREITLNDLNMGHIVFDENSADDENVEDVEHEDEYEYY